MVLNTNIYYCEAVRQELDAIWSVLTGIGSIAFEDEGQYLVDRDEPMEFYREQIIPYKSALELWFLENSTLWLYIKMIFVTVWVVVFPSSTIVGGAFDGIPNLPDSLI